jgi:ribosomal protein S18 acetylase RimI-like enzyme
MACDRSSATRVDLPKNGCTTPFVYACPPALAERGFSIRPETEEDAPFARQLFDEARRVEYSFLPLDDRQKALLIHQQFDVQHRQYATQYGPAQFLMIDDAAGPIGRLYIGTVPRGLRVLDITIQEERRGEGIGDALLRGLIAQARERHLRVSLHVDKLNRARNLYERLGFRVVGDAGQAWLMDWRATAPTS